MKCSQCETMLSAFIDRELDGTSALMVQRHIAECGECREELEALRATKLTLSSIPRIEPTADSFERVRAAVLSSERQRVIQWKFASGLIAAATFATLLAMYTSRPAPQPLADKMEPNMISQDEVYMASSDPSATHVPVFNASDNSR